MRIGEALIREGCVTPEQLEEALRAKVIYGGRLGTNIIELGHTDLDSLAQALGVHHGLAAALQRHFDEADPALQRRLPAAMARDLGCIPLAVVNETPRLIAVAFMDPPDPQPLADVAQALDAEIIPSIAPELRLRYQMERVYGIPRPNRYKRVRTGAQRILDADREQVNKRHYVHPITDPGPDLAPEGPPVVADTADTDEDETPALGRISLKRTYRRPDTAALEALVDFESARKNIRRSTDRDKVVDTLLRCMRQGLDHKLGLGAFFVVRNDMAIGWRGYSHFADADETIGSLAVPLDRPSVLQLAYATQVPVCGKPPANGEPINQRFWELLGCAAPESVICCPLVVDTYVVGLLYSHAEDLGPIPQPIIEQVIELSRVASASFLRLLRSSQR